MHMELAQETLEVMSLVGQAVGLALIILILLAALGHIASSFLHLRL